VQLSVLRPVPSSELTGGIIGAAIITGAMVAAGFVHQTGDRIRYQPGIAVDSCLRHSRRIRCQPVSRPLSRARARMVGCWEFLALATGVWCVIPEWAGRVQKQARVRLISGTHRAAVLIAMNTLLLSKIFYRFGSVFSAWRSKCGRSAVLHSMLFLISAAVFLIGLNEC
jgi:hypothetical protein